MDPQPLDPRSIDWDRERPQSRRPVAPLRRRWWIALGAFIVLLGFGGVAVLAPRGPDEREVARAKRTADLSRLRVRQVELKQRAEQLDAALRSYVVEHPGDIDAVKYAADPENKMDLKTGELLAEYSKDLDKTFLLLITRPEGLGAEMAYRSNIRGALLAARAVLELRGARQDLGQIERDIAALGEKP